jgi:hypothetical protein
MDQQEQAIMQLVFSIEFFQSAHDKRAAKDFFEVEHLALDQISVRCIQQALLLLISRSYEYSSLRPFSGLTEILVVHYVYQRITATQGRGSYLYKALISLIDMHLAC